MRVGSTSGNRRAPQRRATPADRSANRSATSGPAPTSGGQRRRVKQRPARRLSPAVLGTMTLVIAAVGATGVWNGPDQAASAMVADPVTGVMRSVDVDPADQSLEVDVSPVLDRVELKSRATEQAEQRAVALSDVDTQVQTRTDEVEREELAQKKKDEAEQKKKDEAKAAKDAEDAERRKNQWVMPVATYQLTARFGQQSSLWSSGSHTGLDFAGPSGTEIVAVAGGTVTSAGYSGAYGMRTVLTLPDGMEIWFAHQSQISVSAGQTVQPGDVIGYTGATGNVTGPHLHLEVRPAGGSPVDPVAVLASHGVQL